MAFELMSEFGWTWADYEATPLLVRQFCWDFILRRRRVQNSRGAEPAPSVGGTTANVIRVKR